MAQLFWHCPRHPESHPLSEPPGYHGQTVERKALDEQEKHISYLKAQ